MPNIAPFRMKKYLNAAIENNFCIVIQNDKYNKFVPLNYEQRLKEIANEMKHMRADVNKLDERVASIEKEPTAEYKDTKKQIRNTIINSCFSRVIFS